jgi:hypothetical protein
MQEDHEVSFLSIEDSIVVFFSMLRISSLFFQSADGCFKIFFDHKMYNIVNEAKQDQILVQIKRIRVEK